VNYVATLPMEINAFPTYGGADKNIRKQRCIECSKQCTAVLCVTCAEFDGGRLSPYYVPEVIIALLLAHAAKFLQEVNQTRRNWFSLLLARLVQAAD